MQQKNTDISKSYYEEITENGIFDFVCDNGHRSITVMQQQKFEILSRMCVLSIENGVYRDAISSFASCLERLYEFYFKASARKNGASLEEIVTTWKQMSSQSERQYGAFMAIYLFENHKTPNILQRKQTELRNDVIHKGKIPTRDETMQFGQAVLNCALPIMDIIRSKPYSEVIWQMVVENRNERARSYFDAEAEIAYLSLPTPLSLNISQQTSELNELLKIYHNSYVK
ncbi:hypothetical protein [Methylobacterium platani]|uniref:hypothetical protein n=1 Tax=Methylobacterium platani TaxID=427683 RepID=UPI0012E2F278|nr:hypothetical protein [Methylobacterium platani]